MEKKNYIHCIAALRVRFHEKTTFFFFFFNLKTNEIFICTNKRKRVRMDYCCYSAVLNGQHCMCCSRGTVSPLEIGLVTRSDVVLVLAARNCFFFFFWRFWNDTLFQYDARVFSRDDNSAWKRVRLVKHIIYYVHVEKNADRQSNFGTPFSVDGGQNNTKYKLVKVILGGGSILFARGSSKNRKRFITSL